MDIYKSDKLDNKGIQSGHFVQLMEGMLQFYEARIDPVRKVPNTNSLHRSRASRRSVNARRTRHGSGYY
jgi:hypothetical protein